MWPTLMDYYSNCLACVKLLRAPLRRTLMLAPILAALLLLATIATGFVRMGANAGGRTRDATRSLEQSTNGRRNANLAKNSSLLYECELSYLQMDLSLIKFSINYLEFHGEDLQAPPASIEMQRIDSAANETATGSPMLPAGFRLVQIDYNTTTDELANRTKIEAKLPFVFFINGFNTFAPYDEINATWMYEVARSFAKRSHDYRLQRQQQQQLSVSVEANNSGLLARIQRFISPRKSGSRIKSNDEQQQQQQQRRRRRRRPRPDGGAFESGRNVLFLTWSIPDLFASNLFSMIPAYYKTVANYDLIVDYVAGTMLKVVALVERMNAFESDEARASYYAQFQFYGHSLGSHILSDAISRLIGELSRAQTRTNLTLGSGLQSALGITPFGLPQQTLPLPARPMRFGKLMGLDPASPCFVNLEYGISSNKVDEAVNEVVVLHSNAGFAGIPNERANLEIVLNGGTFQPGCVWYDFTCSHVRSTDILSYIDDECQMVAYKCTSYGHFKRGACETCPASAPASPHPSPATASGTPSSPVHRTSAQTCVLVNLPEQHRDKPEVLAYAERQSNRTRQLAQRDGGAPFEVSFDWLQMAGGGSGGRPLVNYAASNTEESATAAMVKSKKNYFHYVNTNANFRYGRKSHCLQHYQLRLLIYTSEEHHLSLRERCKLSSFYLKSSDEIKLKLFYELANDIGGMQNAPHEGARTAAGRSMLTTHDYWRPLLSRFKLTREGRKADTTTSAQENGDLPKRPPLRATKLFLDTDDPHQMSSQIKLNAVVRDVFHTALANFEADAKLFVGAQLGNLDLDGLAQCYRRENATSGPKFVLDIAFMSHTNQKIRNAYSSVLCGQLMLAAPVGAADHITQDGSSTSTARLDGDKSSQASPSVDAGGGDDLTLNLCKQSELENVSIEFDKLLKRIKLQSMDETWKVSLLNSLFSLFTEWEPF